MSLDQAATYALALERAPDQTNSAAMIDRSDAGPRGSLTTRQVEVLRLVAVGKTNREIAEVLVLSHRTVQRHLDNIFAKLGVSSRVAATTAALRSGTI